MSSQAPTESQTHTRARGLVLCLAAAALLVFAPVTVKFGPSGLQIDAAAAFAKSGSGKDGNGDDDDDDDDDDRDDDDDDDKDDDRDGDNSGPGSSNSGSGSVDRDREAGQDRRGADDDRSGRSGGNDGSAVARVGVTSNGIVVIYRDGSQELVEDGLYRRLTSAGRIVENRTATGADLVRLRALAGGKPAAASARKSSDGPGHPARIRIRGRDITVEYSNGWTESVARGRYRLTDRYGHVATDRGATEKDRARLMALAGK